MAIDTDGMRWGGMALLVEDSPGDVPIGSQPAHVHSGPKPRNEGPELGGQEAQEKTTE